MESQTIASRPAYAGRPPLRLSLIGDERLARLVGEGNERAFAALYERYHQRLFRYCRSMLRSDVDAEDALQSTLAGAFAALRRGQRDAPLRPWLFRIAHNESVSLLRRHRPECELSEAGDRLTLSVQERAEERERLARLVADLRELPERQRGALVMRELNGLSHEDIAIALGISTGVAKQTVFEARRSLLEMAEGRAMACEEIRRIISDGDGRALRARRVRAHLRGCSGCAAFAAAIPARAADLRVLAPPLPAMAAAGVLARLVGSGSGHGGGGAGGLAAGAAGKTAGAALAAKALAGVAIVATATVGVTTAITRVANTSHSPPAAHAATARHSGAANQRATLGSPAVAETGRRRTARAGTIGVGAASASNASRARSAGHTRIAASGLGGGTSRAAQRPAAAGGPLAAAAPRTSNPGALRKPTAGAGSGGARHRAGRFSSRSAARRPGTSRVVPRRGAPGISAGRSRTRAAGNAGLPGGSSPAGEQTPSSQPPAKDALQIGRDFSRVGA